MSPARKNRWSAITASIVMSVAASEKNRIMTTWYPPSSNSTDHQKRNNWARLIQKIYELDLLTCPKCQCRSKIPSLAGMRILAFIENDQLIKKILKHLGLWEVKARPPPRGNPSPSNIHIDYSARPGAKCLPIIGLDYVLYLNLIFWVYRTGDRSGPGILRFQLPRIIATAIRITPLRLMPYDFFKTGYRI